MKIILILLMTTSIFAQDTKKTMSKSLDSIKKLIPYISQELKFNDPKNTKDINLYLENILQAFKQGKHNKDLKQAGFNPSFETIQDHIQETIDNFNSSNKDYSFALARNITPICLSCHNQLPKDMGSSFSVGIKQLKRKDFETDFEYGEFLYLVRDYNNAHIEYMKVIKKALLKQKALIQEKKKSKNKDTFEFEDGILSDALIKILEIDIRIKRDFARAEKYFKKIARNSYLPTSNKNSVKAWLEDIQRWKKLFPKGINIKTDADLDAFVKKYLEPFYKDGITLTDDSNVDMLVAAGVLSNYLFRHGNEKNTPEILLWMGLAENVLGKNVFYTLGDHYLKECVNKYRKSKYAKDCLKEYKNSIEFRYTGSSGTHIPSSVKKSIEKLEQKIQ